MKKFNVRIAVIALSMLGLSSTTFAGHPVENTVQIDRDSLQWLQLNQVQLRHTDDDQYQLTGKVRRLKSQSIPKGYLVLKAFDDQGNLVYESTEYLWSQVVKQQYKSTPEFTFEVPKEAIEAANIQLSFYTNQLADRPKSKEWGVGRSRAFDFQRRGKFY